MINHFQLQKKVIDAKLLSFLATFFPNVNTALTKVPAHSQSYTAAAVDKMRYFVLAFL